MTPDERALLTSFLQDLGQARAGQKDPEAAQMIGQAMNRGPDAPYLLVQHAILADQALHAAQARIADLEAQLRNVQVPSQPTNFLGAAGGPWGRQAPPQNSPPQDSRPQTAVPPSGYAPPPQYAPGPQYGPFSQGGGLGSFLRSAGTTAAGVAGGEMLFSGLSGLFGGRGGGFGGGMFGGPGLFGGGGGYAQPAENVTINNYDDAGAGSGAPQGDQYANDPGGFGGSDDGSSSL